MTSFKPYVLPFVLYVFVLVIMAGSVSALTTVSSCQGISTDNDAYQLDQNLSANGTSCLQIDAENVTLTCAGFAIIGNRTLNVVGVTVNQTRNVTISGCTFWNFTSAIALNNSNESTLFNNTLYDIYGSSGTRNAILVNRSDGVNVSYSHLEILALGQTGTTGIYFLNSSNGTIQSNNVTGRWGTRVYLSDLSPYATVYLNNLSTTSSTANLFGALTAVDNFSYSNVSYNTVYQDYSGGSNQITGFSFAYLGSQDAPVWNLYVAFNNVTVFDRGNSGVSYGMILNNMSGGNVLNNTVVMDSDASGYGLSVQNTNHTLFANNSVTLSDSFGDNGNLHAVGLRYFVTGDKGGPTNTTWRNNTLSSNAGHLISIQNSNQFQSPASIYDHDIDIGNVDASARPIYYYFNQSDTALGNLSNVAEFLCAYCDNVSVGNVSGGRAVFNNVNNSVLDSVTVSRTSLGDQGAVWTGYSFNITVSNATVSTTGNYSYGFQIQSGNNVTLRESNITTSGATAYGAYESNAGSYYTVFRSTINTSGDTAYAVFMENVDNVSANVLLTSGSAAYGIYVYDDLVDIHDNTINVTGAGNTYGIYGNDMNNSGINSSGNVVNASGSSGYGFRGKANNWQSVNDVFFSTPFAGIRVDSGGTGHSNFTNLTSTGKAGVYLIAMTSAKTGIFTFYNSNLTGSAFNDLIIAGSRFMAELVNMSVNYSQGVWNSIPLSSNITQSWPLTVRVLDNNSAALESANVTVYNVNGSVLYSALTNSTGYVDSRNVTHLFLDGSDNTTINSTPHNVTVFSGSTFNSTNVTLTSQQEAILTLNIVSNNSIELDGPAEGNISSLPAFNFTFNASSTSTFGNCSVFTNSSGVWASEQGNTTSIVNGSTSYIDVNFSGNGQMLWGVQCQTDSATFWSTSNRTVFFDNTTPSVIFHSPDNNTNTTVANTALEVNVTDNVFGVTNCSLYLNSTLNNSQLVANASTYSVTPGLPPGTYLWNVACFDNASNTNTSINRTLDVQANSPPVVTFQDPANNSIQSTRNLTVTYLPTDNNSVIFAGCWAHSNETAWGPKVGNSTAITNGSNNTIILNFSGDGNFLWNVACYDQNNQSAFATGNFSVTIDNTTPALALVSPAANNSNVTTNYTFVNFTYTENNIDTCILEYSNATATENYTMTKVAGSCSYNVTANFTNAISQTHNFTVYLNDTAGHLNSSGVYLVFFDATSPSNLALVSPSANNTIVTVNYTFINVTFAEANPVNCILQYGNSTATENYTMTLVDDAGATGSCSLNISGNFSGTSNQTHNFTVFVNDSTGHLASNGTFFVHYSNSDSVAPSITLATPANAAFVTSDPVFTFSFTDAVSATSACTLWFDGSVAGYNGSVNNATATAISSNASVNASTHTWFVQCTDLSFNSANATAYTFTRPAGGGSTPVSAPPAISLPSSSSSSPKTQILASEQPPQSGSSDADQAGSEQPSSGSVAVSVPEVVTEITRPVPKVKPVLYCTPGEPQKIVTTRTVEVLDVQDNGVSRQDTQVTLNIENQGNLAVDGTQLRDTLPVHVFDVVFAIQPDLVAAPQVMWKLEELAPGQKKSVSYVVKGRVVSQDAFSEPNVQVNQPISAKPDDSGKWVWWLISAAGLAGLGYLFLVPKGRRGHGGLLVVMLVALLVVPLAFAAPQTHVSESTITPLNCEFGGVPLTISRTLKVEKVISEVDRQNSESYRSTITLNLKNDAGILLKNVIIKEKIPDSVAQNPDELSLFSQPPRSFEQGSVVVTWLFENAEPGEEKNVSYSVDKKLDQGVLDEYEAPQVISQSKRPKDVPVVSSPADSGVTPAGGDLLFPGIAVLILLALVGAYFFTRQHQNR